MKPRSVMTGQKNTKKVTLVVYFNLEHLGLLCSILGSKYQFGEISFNCNSFVGLIKDRKDSIV